MSVLFFEGFNYSDSDNIKLNSFFWSVNNPTKISFAGGRTNNMIRLENRPSNSGLDANTVLSLQNFTDPLINNSGFAIGFAIGGNCIAHRSLNQSTSPYLENFIKFYDNNSEVLSLDIIRTSGNYGNSLGFGVYQNNSLVDVYDLKSHLGYSWTIGDNGTYLYLANAAYIDIYIDPINSGEISINFSANNTNNAQLRNTSNQYYTSISGFSSLNQINFYSNGYTSSQFMSLDDLYIKGGNTREECVLGNSVKIYQLTLNSNTSANDWKSIPSAPGSEYFYLTNNDGDAGYILSSNSGDISLYNLTDLPNDSPSGVAGIKISNIVRSSNIDTDWNFVNLMSDGTNTVEDTNVYTVDSTIYSTKESFIFENPITESGWLKSDINSLQIGLKNLGIQ